MLEILITTVVIITVIIAIALSKGSDVPVTINVDEPKYQEDIKSIICAGDCTHCEDSDWCAFSDKKGAVK